MIPKSSPSNECEAPVLTSSPSSNSWEHPDPNLPCCLGILASVAIILQMAKLGLTHVWTGNDGKLTSFPAAIAKIYNKDFLQRNICITRMRARRRQSASRLSGRTTVVIDAR